MNTGVSTEEALRRFAEVEKFRASFDGKLSIAETNRVMAALEALLKEREMIRGALQDRADRYTIERLMTAADGALLKFALSE